MKLPVLRSVNISEIYISGDVVIDDSAVIAEGVILQAVKGSKIVIHAGVCIGMGSIIKAYDGTIEIKENAVLGAGVLIIGNSTIDSQVCISTCTTIYNTSIETSNIIAAGSLLGDYQIKSEDFKTTEMTGDRQQEIKTEKKEDKNPLKSNIANVNQTDNLIENLNELDTESDLWDLSENQIKEDFIEKKENVIVKESSTQNNNQNSVVGQIYINKLLVTLFPEKQKINKSNTL